MSYFRCGFDGTIVEAKVTYGYSNSDPTNVKGRTPNMIRYPKCGNFIPFKNEVIK